MDFGTRSVFISLRPAPNGTLQEVRSGPQSDHLGDSGLPVPGREEELAGGSGCTASVRVGRALTSTGRLSPTSGSCSSYNPSLARRPAAPTPGPRITFGILSSVQVEAVPPGQTRALCIQTAGCYGQSGNGGQGTDRGRGSLPVDSHHPHRGRLSSSERFVTLLGHPGGGGGGPVEPRLHAAARRFTVRSQARRSSVMRSGSARCYCPSSLKPALHGRAYVELRSAPTANRRPPVFLFNGVQPVKPVKEITQIAKYKV